MAKIIFRTDKPEEVTELVKKAIAAELCRLENSQRTASGKRMRKVKLIEPKQHKAISANLNYAIVWGMALEAKDRPQSIQKWLGLPCFSGASVAPQPINKPPAPAPQLNFNPLNFFNPPQGDDLRSERGVDYTRLQRLLQQQRWKDADEETTRRMLEAVKREKEGWFRVEDVKNFPRTDLRTIDQLWVNYSKGQFGFSVQKRIWLDLGGKLGEYDWDTFEKLGDRVGWRKNGSWLNYSDYTFTTNALQGHLPAWWEFGVAYLPWGGYSVTLWEGCGTLGYSFLFSRL
ncbi:MAG: GUN4 domain-containing protein [Roseofilum sp. SBFL]|uniref:GUN4 domain-containing protein n=1 Tax=unclassified Roseofilum TaxID=2620099 RepID=UPI001AFDE402|nr:MULTISPECIES: GUN4 domain-containing protein [unclassified Roseofilum]MBP0013300.1 GUN4 domain-containing protein [Roseofilum sp. SID3]MBP0025883.1 GUN4 domain-containing protein [Roseofilum sp. SID2]MBP0038426.1 GUN4 domain-containing protein [Roseofilum sp. SID1]MBP0044535.1 GUN4 domain-containing protein [Roseofilum sp. SBFL]